MREEKYKRDFFLCQILCTTIHKTFFASKRNGFFIEVGGLNGVAHDSSSFFYMRGI